MPDPAASSSLQDRSHTALARAAGAIARLDQALAEHPLQQAFLRRARLEAVRLQAAVDGQAVDRWHLAALLEGLRLRMDGALRIIDRGAIFEAARHALILHQWLTTPAADQESDIRLAERALDTSEATPLLVGARGMHRWLDSGGDRAPIRAALVRHWSKHGLLRIPVPLTASTALRTGTDWTEASWVAAFLNAIADEADGGLRLLLDLERAWFTARGLVAGRRRNSRASAAVDLLAALSLLSPASLAAGLGMSVGNAAALLDSFCAAGIAVEVTHRSKRRLFGLAGLAPLRDEVAPPRRPEPGRRRGRPRDAALEQPLTPPVPKLPLTTVERRASDYGDLQTAMANAEAAIHRTRRNLNALLGATSDAGVQSRDARD